MTSVHMFEQQVVDMTIKQLLLSQVFCTQYINQSAHKGINSIYLSRATKTV